MLVITKDRTRRRPWYRILQVLLILVCLSHVVILHAQDTDNDGVVDALDMDDDNDGILDVLEYPLGFVHVDDATNSISVYLTNGVATFSDTAITTVMSEDIGVGDNESTLMGDLNNDGVVDLFFADDSSNVIRVYLNNGDGTFNATAITTAFTNNAGYDGNEAGFLRDVTGDGNLDFMHVVVSGNAIVRVYAGDGTGGFNTTAITTTLSNTDIGVEGSENTLMGDLNGDGYDDLFFADDTSNVIRVYLRNGVGTFNTTAITTTYSGNAGQDENESGFLRDITGDGHLDFVHVVDNTTLNISTYAGDGTGGFNTTAITSTLSGTDIGVNNNENTLMADLNGDGFEELFFADDSSNVIHVYLNNRDGTFNATAITTTFNNDAGQDGGEAAFLSRYIVNANTDGTTAANDLDLDSDDDGIPDNIEAQATATYIAPGTFTDANSNGVHDSYESAQGGTDILPVDTDGDGTPDFKDTNSDGDSTSDIDESGLGAVGTIQANGLGTNVGGSATYTSDDINGLAHDGTNFNLSDTDNDTNTDGTNAAYGIDFDYRDAITDVDTDGDGVFDRVDIDDDNDGIIDANESRVGLIWANAQNSSILNYEITYKSTSNPTLFETTPVEGTATANGNITFDNGRGTHGSMMGDVNGDGITDLVNVREDTKRVEVFLGDNSDSFADAILTTVTGTFNTGNGDGNVNGAAGYGVYDLIDVNGDGNDDYIWVNAQNSSTLNSNVLLSNGDGTFQSTAVVDTATGGNNMYFDTRRDNYAGLIGDVNNDGFADLVYASEVQDRMDVFLGDGLGSFADRIETVSWTGNTGNENHFGYMTVADFNSDGNADVLWAHNVSGGNTANIEVTFSNGDGTFQTIPQVSTATIIGGNTSYFDYEGNGYFVISGDANADGHIDIIQIAESMIGILLGDGTGNFADAVYTNGFTGTTIGNTATYGTVALATFLDTDTDGVANRIDLDSDNDGIPDNIEAQATATYISPGIFADANNNGLHDMYESAQGGTDILPVDTDGDGTPDFRDTNSDGDSTTDVDESGLGAVGTIQANGLGANVGGSVTYTSDAINGLVHDGSNFNLTDTDNDTNPDGTNADPSTGFDFDYRDHIMDLDADGDMVFDRFDIDDDNDGILDGIEGGNNNFGTLGLITDTTIWQDLINETPNSVIEDFEAYSTGTNINSLVFEEFTLTATPSSQQTIQGTAHGTAPVSGSRQISVADSSSDDNVINISFNNPVLGFGFYVGDFDVGGSTNFIVEVNGTQIWNTMGGSPVTNTANDGQQYIVGDGIYNFIGYYNSHNLISTVTITLKTSGGENIVLDDFYTIPFSDTDNDGVANSIDLDSDNDGIPDNIEAQATATYIEPGTFTDANNNGLYDGYESVQGGTDILPIDTDGDGTPDFRDTNSDGDSTADIDESGLGAVGAIQANGLGANVGGSATYTSDDINGLVHDGSNFNLSDTDNDTNTDGTNAAYGIDFDYRDVITDVDTDGDGVFDRVDIDDDNDGIIDANEVRVGVLWANAQNSSTLSYEITYKSTSNPTLFETTPVVGTLTANGNITFDNGRGTHGSMMGDVNGDGITDLVNVREDTKRVEVFLGDPFGNFADAILTTVSGTFNTGNGDGNVNGSPGYGVYDLLDVNGDGNEDYIWANAQNSTSLTSNVLLSNGDGTFQSTAVVDTSTGGNNMYFDTRRDNNVGLMGDVNNDGFADLVFVNDIYTRIDVFLGDGLGNFADRIETASWTGNTGNANQRGYMTVADFNSDGNADVLWAHNASGGNTANIEVTFGNGDGTFQTMPQVSTTTIIGGNDSYIDYEGTGYFVISGDANADGNIDLIQIADTMVGILLGDGAGNFADAVYTNGLTGSTIGKNPTYGTVALITFSDADTDGIVNSIDLDSDNDGIPDNIEAQATATYISLGTFTDANNNGLHDGYESAQGGTDILPVDTDGDSIPDFRDTNSDGDSTSDIDESGLGAVGPIQANGLGANVGGSLTYTSDDINGLAHDGTNFNLSDTDNDTNTDGTNAILLDIDFDYRDNRDDTDTDGDMVIDVIDIDDDNDGILDVIEGGNNNFATTGLIVDTTIWQNLVDEIPNATLEDFGTYSPGTNVDAIDFADFNISVTPNESIHSYNSGSIWMSNANTNYSASISFDEPVLGFGFSLVDLGHSATVLIISIDGTEVWNSSSSGSSTSMTNSIDGREVAVGLNVDTFFGYYISTPFTSVSVTVQNGSNDGFALDNIYTIPYLDMDNDGVANAIDLDSDNDGIPDNIEAQATATYIAPSTFTDIDGDGLHDSYDADTDVGTTTMDTSIGLTPVNTDGIDAVDYLDTDADNDGTFDIVESGLANNDVDNDGMTDGAVGVNGLDDDASIESTDDYTDINGLAHDGSNFSLVDTDNDTNADGANADPSNGFDFDYRDAITDIDTDGDMVFNRFDIDDDNDGIIDAQEITLSVTEELVQNGDFNSGTTNWILTGNVFLNVDRLRFNGGYTTPTGSAYQDIPTVFGIEYSVTYDVSFTGSGGTTILELYINDVFVRSITGQMNNVEQNFIASGTSTKIEFRDASTGNLNNIDLILDNVSILFSDTDDDGIADFIDLDSDNDGIPDTIEAQATASYIVPSPFTDIDGDGLHDSYDADTDVGTTTIVTSIGLTPVNTDGIDAVDYLDTDADNDGIFDIIESGLANNDADNDGMTDGAVGVNGLDDDASIESTDDYTDVNGLAHDGSSFSLADTDNDTNTDGTNANPAMDIDFDYRDAILDMDTDDDMVLDRFDIDDDNDGILDIQEGDLVYAMNSGGGVVSYPSISDFVNQTNGVILGTPGGGFDGANNAFWMGGAANQVYAIADNGTIYSYPTILDFVNLSNGALVGTPGGGWDGSNNVYWMGASETLYAMADNGSVYNYPSMTDFVNQTNGVVLGTPGGGWDGTNNDFWLGETGRLYGIDDSGQVVSWASMTDFINQTNETIIGSPTNGWTGSVNKFWAPAFNDWDGDSIPNILDLDSDNDGIPDNIEAQTTATYISPSPFTDIDGDGLHDSYDADTDVGTTTMVTSIGLTPVNTDGIDTVDYLDTDADNDGTFDIVESGLANNDADNDGMTDGAVGVNGLDDDAGIESTDDYTDVNGLAHDGTNFNLSDTDNDTHIDGANADPSTGVDFDYRDAIDSYKVFMRHGKFFRGGAKKKMEFGKRN